MTIKLIVIVNNNNNGVSYIKHYKLPSNIGQVNINFNASSEKKLH